jgi:hypothetical protein
MPASRVPEESQKLQPAGLRATLIKVPISGTTSDFDPLIAQCEISALRLA